MSSISIETDGPIVVISINRPPVNALSVAALDELIGAIHAVENSDTIRAAVLTGSGRCFSAGMDLEEQLLEQEQGRPGPVGRAVDLYKALLEGKKPIVAAINGPALGAGFGIAASCCILVATHTAEVGLPEINVGTLGGARHAMRLFGHSIVNRMVLTGYRLKADELASRHVVEACVAPDELLPYARRIAFEIAEKDPQAISLARQCLSKVEVMPVLEGFALEMALSENLRRAPSSLALMKNFRN